MSAQTSVPFFFNKGKHVTIKKTYTVIFCKHKF